MDDLSADVKDLSDRVTALEEAKGIKPVGWIDYRVGMVGKDLEGDYWFDNLTVKLGAEGQVTDDLFARVMLKMRDNPQVEPVADPGWWMAGWLPGYIADRYNQRIAEELQNMWWLIWWREEWIPDDALKYDANFMTVDGRGACNPWLQDLVWLDEAYLQFNTKGLWTAKWTVGRQYLRYGLGLVVNNDRKSLQGVRMQATDLWGSNFDLDVFAGGGNMDYSFRFPAWGDLLGLGYLGDSYLAARLSYDRPSWAVGVNYLANGYAEEEAWSADLWWKYWGDRELWAEYAEQKQFFDGGDPDDMDLDPYAVLVMADLWKAPKWWLRGMWGKTKDFYSIVYSTLNPYFEDYVVRPWESGVVPGYIPVERWTRCVPIFRQVETIGGTLGFKLGSWPIEFSYYDLDQVDDAPLAYDKLWSISVSKEVANGVTLHLLYGREEATNDPQFLQYVNQYSNYNLSRYDDAEVLVGRLTVSF